MSPVHCDDFAFCAGFLHQLAHFWRLLVWHLLVGGSLDEEEGGVAFLVAGVEGFSVGEFSEIVDGDELFCGDGGSVAEGLVFDFEFGRIFGIGRREGEIEEDGGAGPGRAGFGVGRGEGEEGDEG